MPSWRSVGIDEIGDAELLVAALQGAGFDRKTWRERITAWLTVGGERGLMALCDRPGLLLAFFRFEVEGPPESLRVLSVGDVACAEMGGTALGVRAMLAMIRDLAKARACAKIRLQLDGYDDGLAFRSAAERYGFAPIGTIWSAAAERAGAILPFARPALHRP